MACQPSLGLCFPVFESNRLSPRKVFLLFLYSYVLVPHFRLVRFSQILLDTISLPRFSNQAEAGFENQGRYYLGKKYC